MESPQPLAGGKLILDYPGEQIARISLNNSAKHNALDHEILDGLAATFAGLSARCVLLAAVGKSFSAGYDIASLSRGDFVRRAEDLIAHPFSAALQAVADYPYPTIAVIDGPAIGGGLELALHCDLRLASSRARFAMPPAKIGLVYSHTGLSKFIETIGAPRTRELFFRAKATDAETAAAWGLINQVVPDEELTGRVLSWAEGIASLSPTSLTGNKEIIASLTASRLTDDESRRLVELHNRSLGGEEFREGISAFEQRRKPNWD